MNVNESENIPVNESVNVNVNENESENLNVNESENLNVNESENVNVNVNCNESENITGGLRDKGKRKLYEQYLNESSSEFDDSSDEDYVQPIIDGDSDTPSLVLEDIEVESDDDIFSNKNPTKLELVKKLKKVMKDSQKAKLKQKSVIEVLRIGVRNGYDIEFIKNETSRITAKCKVDGCEWRIHASPIMKGPTFQIKTLKGNHTCARTYQNSLAKATYLATRMESSIRDHPDIPIQQLKNRILRKCNVEVSRFKVLRAKKKALEAIRGSDALQYDKLWDYCETVRKCNPGNRQKGLIEALKELVPDSEHRFCTRHMYQNFKQKFKSVELKEYFWKAASIANKQDFERYMKKIQEIDPKVSEDVETAYEWLEKVNPEHWVRAFFPVHSKSDILVNNLCESFNSYILEARDKPIISMFEWIRTKLMMRLQQKREGMENTSFEPLKPPAMKKQRGRPKKLRRRGPDELSQSKVSTRKGLTHTCTKCLETGHNKNSCSNPINPRSKYFKGSLPEEIPQGSQAPPTSQEQATEQVRKRDPKEEVTYKGPRNAALLGMTASIQTTVEQTPMATNLGTNDGSGGPSHSIPEKEDTRKEQP
ncbi:hypothetical protein Sango_0624300 [Sesamum angolense]|uniref:Transposase MuDR plant domain-containing protein n=1 Tax=Sesamum angolense TaxID=2727404 RepID=A0AAE1X6H5_9LAMI|nr:hypothetical protein Sango_0624300 [Sesamum angolense]